MKRNGNGDGMIMVNPCEQCLVTSMCKEGCTLLIDYLKDSLTYKFLPHSLKFIATRIRKNKISLINDDTRLISSKKLELLSPKDYWAVKFSKLKEL